MIDNRMGDSRMEDKEDYLSTLNERQLDAVTTTEGYVRIIAGAGTGKTKALTHRYAYLVNELGISTSNILCVTFTNKAAREMSKRIRQMIGDSDTGYICTFHGFCVKLLREDIHAINFPQNFVVMDDEDTEEILKTVYENAHIQSRTYTFDSARDHITAMKSQMLHIPYLAEIGNEKLLADYEKAEKVEDKVFLGYLYEQKKVYGLDYDDLITIALYILQTDETKRIKWQERMMYVMVDEFQDVSSSQYALAEILSGYHRNLFIVGDPDQTIYTWRGAKIEYILNFDAEHEDTKTVFLDVNYRSIPEILAVSNSLIEKNKKRLPHRLEAYKESGRRPQYIHSKTTGDEAQWMTSEIQRLVSEGASYNEMAVLYRSHFVSRNIEESFIKAKIPYTLYSGVEFYKRKEIKDVLAYLRMIVYSDDLSFRRVINEPKRNFGKKRMSLVKAYAESHRCSLYNGLLDILEDKTIKSTGAAAFVDTIEAFKKTYKEKSLSDLVTEVLDQTGYEAMLRQSGEQERLDNLAEFKQSVDEYEKTSGEENTLEEYLQSIALYTNHDREKDKETVSMMTVHTAKGLEFPYVFACGMNEGIFPSKHVDTEERLEEERRMAYVAFTRAEKALYISDAEGLNYDESFRYPSRFIFNIDRDVIDYAQDLPKRLVDDAMSYIAANESRICPPDTERSVGDRVMHKVFGEGTITAMRTDIGCYVIKFDKMATERNLKIGTALEKLG
jgi:DNA helicase-2/ATP-dependent DNA helicase PcrA